MRTRHRRGGATRHRRGGASREECDANHGDYVDGDCFMDSFHDEDELKKARDTDEYNALRQTLREKDNEGVHYQKLAKATQYHELQNHKKAEAAQYHELLKRSRQVSPELLEEMSRKGGRRRKRKSRRRR